MMWGELRLESSRVALAGGGLQDRWEGRLCLRERLCHMLAEANSLKGSIVVEVLTIEAAEKHPTVAC